MNVRQHTRIFTACAVFALLQAAPTLQAENVHLGTEASSTEEIIELLTPAAGNYKTRGLRLQKDLQADPAASLEAEAQQELQTASEPKSISLEVYFEFDSAELSAHAIEQLAPVGEALRSEELEGLTFELEGHTDAIGGESYNLNLSQRRAEAVRQLFMDEYGVASERLASSGRGEYELLDAENPNSGINRRVRIIAK